jgi:hypothetical protein
MKKFSLLIALALLASGVTLSPSIVKAQDDKKAEFERAWFESCQTKKDDKCLPLSKELIEKYPDSTYVKYAKIKLDNDNLNKLSTKFQAALKDYYGGSPDAAKLETLFTSSEEYLKAQPGQQFVMGHMALAGASGAMGQVYKNLDKVKGYAETALKAFEPTTPPENWKPEEWNSLRELVLAQMNQFLGWRLIEIKGDSNEALDYLTKATQIKGKEGAGWKDPNNYWLRSQIYSNQYTELRKQYDALPDDAAKTGEVGKEILKKVNELLDTKLIPEYARVLATATKPEAKSLYDAAKPQFDAFWKYRTDAAEKADPYVKNYVADPTINTIPIPAKAESADSSGAPAAPAAGASNVKLSSGGGAAMTAGPNGKGSTTGASGAKATPAKGTKAPAKGKKRGRG